MAIFSHFSLFLTPPTPQSPLFVSATLRPSGMGRLGCHGNDLCRVVRLAGVCGVVLDEVCLMSSGTRRRGGGRHSTSFMQCKCGTFELRTPNQHGRPRKGNTAVLGMTTAAREGQKRWLIRSQTHFWTVVNEKWKLQQEAEVGVAYVFRAGLRMAAAF